VRLIHLAAFGGTYGGSFVPMLRRVFAEAQSRGWTCDAVFPADARGRAWASSLTGTATLHFVPLGGHRIERLLARLVGGRRAAILHTHFGNFDVAAARSVAGAANARLFWHEHYDLAPSPVARLRKAAKLALLGRHVERLVCVGPHVIANLRRCGAPAKKLVHLPNAIDTDHFVPATSEQRRSARAALGAGRGDLVLLHYAWDWELKGGRLFLETAAELLRAGLPVRAVTVGGGAAAGDFAAQLGIEHAVHAPAAVDDVRELLAAADVFVSTGAKEGDPLAVLEALSCGVPVVAAHASAPSLARAGLRGHRVVAAQPSAVAADVREVLELRPESMDAERRYVAVQRGLGRWCDRLFALYDDGVS
jgi:glycosyltransferase involved in cell wall biosynthesis